MNPLPFGRLIAGIFVLTSRADGPPPVALEAVVEPPERTWTLQVIPTPPGIDFRIEVLRSDARVRFEILILDSQGHYREPGRTGTTAPPSEDLRSLLRGGRRVTK